MMAPCPDKNYLNQGNLHTEFEPISLQRYSKLEEYFLKYVLHFEMGFLPNNIPEINNPQIETDGDLDKKKGFISLQDNSKFKENFKESDYIVFQRTNNSQKYYLPRSDLKRCATSNLENNGRYKRSKLGGGGLPNSNVDVRAIWEQMFVNIRKDPSGQDREKKVTSSPLTSEAESVQMKLVKSFGKILTLKEAVAFVNPVDIKMEMSFYKIGNKLLRNEYSDPWGLIEDVWKLFNYVIAVYKKNSKIYKFAVLLSEKFDKEMHELMTGLGYCCGHWYIFNAIPLSCLGKELCQIQKNMKYYSCQDKYFFCVKCYKAITTDKVELTEEGTSGTLLLEKDKFELKTNKGTQVENMTVCKDCGKSFHAICVLHMDEIWPNGFRCTNCLKAKVETRSVNEFTAKRLPRTQMATLMEKRVNEYLLKNKIEAGEVIVRVLASTENTVEIFPGMRKRYVETGIVSPPFPYRLKSIYVYQAMTDPITGEYQEICFFSMFAQEYGHECPSPNGRRIYISYLDSVAYFQPAQYRSVIYHEILLGYMEFVKQLGFETLHLWACPPHATNIDYIFYSHPIEQKYPGQQRLQDWYKKLFEKGIERKTVRKFQNIRQFSVEEEISCVSQLPYFDGDCVVKLIEDANTKIENAEKPRLRPKACGGKPKKKIKHPPVAARDEVSVSALANINKNRQQLFVVRLNEKKNSKIKDKDPLIDCVLMKGRDTFLAYSIENYLEFSTLRRTKYSTMRMLYDLYNEKKDF